SLIYANRTNNDRHRNGVSKDNTKNEVLINLCNGVHSVYPSSFPVFDEDDCDGGEPRLASSLSLSRRREYGAPAAPAGERTNVHHCHRYPPNDITRIINI